MRWSEFGWAALVLVVGLWGAHQKDRAERLKADRNDWAKIARQHSDKVAELQGDGRLSAAREFLSERARADLHAEATLATHGVGDPEAITRYMQDRYGHPSHWRPYAEGGVLATGHPYDQDDTP